MKDLLLRRMTKRSEIKIGIEEEKEKMIVGGM